MIYLLSGVVKWQGAAVDSVEGIMRHNQGLQHQ